jgi:hypothetical protein
VSVVCVCSAPNCCDTGEIIKEMPGLVASGTPCSITRQHSQTRTPSANIQYRTGPT